MRFSIFHDTTRSKPWFVTHYVSRKAVRRFFTTQKQAEERQKKLEIAYSSGGLEAVQRIDVDIDLEKAYEIAHSVGKTVLELVRLGAVASKVGTTGPTLFEAFYGFQSRCAQVNLRPKTVSFYAEQLESLMRAVGSDKHTNGLTRAEIRQWIDSRPSRSQPHALRAARAWFRWMRRQEPPLVDLDPTSGMGIDAPIEERRIAFLTVKDSAALLGASPDTIRPAVALMLFAGIRHNELHRDDVATGVDVLRWEDVDFAHRSITVRADVAKTRVARTIRKLPINLWAWLRPFQEAKGQVCAASLRGALDDARAKANLGTKWSKSILRHTCASHHAAAFGNLSATALLIRHEGDVTLLNRRYREGVSISKADGKAFFALLPVRGGEPRT